MEPSEAVGRAFLIFGANYQAIIHTALCIRDIEAGGKSRGLSGCDFQRSRSEGPAFLDFSIDLLKFLPDETWAVERIARYSTGSREACYVVRRFIGAVPDAVWIEGARISSKV